MPRRLRLALETLEDRSLPSGLLPAYDIGTPTLRDIWVDPLNGVNSNDGQTRDRAVRTLIEAWNRVPQGATLSVGYRINLVAGTYSEAIVPLYWEARHGTQQAPVIIQAVDGAGTVHLPNVNVFDCSYFYLIGLDISSRGGDVLHFDSCSHVLVRDTIVRGVGNIAAYDSPQETLKANQTQHLYIEHSDISGAFDNAIDFVGVQYGHVVGSKIHRAVDWAMYAKGGSAYLTIAGNEFYDAGTGGFSAGQGTGFEFMVGPWLHYEAYDIKFVNNIVHDTEGAGIGVQGGYNILMANNTLYRVGRRSHVIEVVHGSRTCDGNRTRAQTYLNQGGWGTTVIGGDEPIPNRNVFIYNNVVYNPDGYQSQWQQFTIANPRTPSAGSNISSPSRADVNLQIKGNIIWNGPAGHSLGIENAALAEQIARDNLINTVRPLLVDPGNGDFHLVPGSDFTSLDIPNFTWADAPPVPAGTLSNAVSYDYAGDARLGGGLPGAFATGGGPPAQADLRVQAAAPTAITLGATIAYVFTVSNLGPDSANGVRLTLPLPGTVAFRTANVSQGTATTSGNTVICNLGTLASGGAATVTIVVAPRTSGTVNVTAQVTGNIVDADASNNAAPVGVTVNANPLPAFVAAGADAGNAPLVRIYVAATGNLLRTISAFAPSFRGGVRVTLGDVNADGTPDIIAAPGRGLAPKIHVFDGRTGAMLSGGIGEFYAYARTFTAGVFVAAADINGDGRADVITGPEAGGPTTVKVFDGRNGALLRTIVAFAAGTPGGIRVAAGDVNGDGRADVLAASGPGAAPLVRVFDGLTQARMRNFNPYGSGFRGGIFITAGDVNGDGRADFIIGAGNGADPRVRVLSGGDGSVLADFLALDAGYRGGVRVAAVDVNGDGRADIIAAPAALPSPRLRVFDSLTFGELTTFVAQSLAHIAAANV